jgi:hypothetical protein
MTDFSANSGEPQQGLVIKANTCKHRLARNWHLLCEGQVQ